MTSKIQPAQDAGIAPAQGIDWNAAIQVAVKLGPEGVATLERLQAIQREERELESKRAFVSAMVALRSELPPITKTVPGAHGVTKKGGRTHGMYAPLDTITAVLDPFCAKHGFVYDFDREVVEGRPDDYMVCIITHEGGHEKRNHYPAPRGEGNRGTNKLMTEGIGESYAKRYALVAAFGITTADPDTDAQMPADRGNPDAPAGPITPAQAATIRDRVMARNPDGDPEKVEYSMLEYLTQAWRFESPIMRIEDIPASHYEDAFRATAPRGAAK